MIRALLRILASVFGWKPRKRVVRQRGVPNANNFHRLADRARRGNA